MKRTNTFKLDPSPREEEYLFELAENCAKLWNVLNYRRRRSFFDGEIDWSSSELYDKYKGRIGSATAQQVIRKNDEAWPSFLALLKQKKNNRLPPHIRRVSPPATGRTITEIGSSGS